MIKVQKIIGFIIMTFSVLLALIMWIGIGIPTGAQEWVACLMANFMLSLSAGIGLSLFLDLDW